MYDLINNCILEKQHYFYFTWVKCPKSPLSITLRDQHNVLFQQLLQNVLSWHTFIKWQLIRTDKKHRCNSLHLYWKYQMQTRNTIYNHFKVNIHSWKGSAIFIRRMLHKWLLSIKGRTWNPTPLVHQDMTKKTTCYEKYKER